jgi:hypothetical protein
VGRMIAIGVLSVVLTNAESRAPASPGRHPLSRLGRAVRRICLGRAGPSAAVLLMGNTGGRRAEGEPDRRTHGQLGATLPRVVRRRRTCPTRFATPARETQHSNNPIARPRALGRFLPCHVAYLMPKIAVPGMSRSPTGPEKIRGDSHGTRNTSSVCRKPARQRLRIFSEVSAGSQPTDGTTRELSRNPGCCRAGPTHFLHSEG